MWDNDMRKAHPSVVCSLAGEAVPALRSLVDNPEQYLGHGTASQLPVALVKLYVNQRCIGSPCTASPRQSFVRTAKELGVGYEDAVWGLRALDRRLATVCAEIDAWLLKEFGRCRGRGLPRTASCLLMRHESVFIAACERECRALGIRTWNLHDGFISDKQVPDYVFEAARLETDLVDVTMRSEVVSK
jgi:hypothetical protein